MLRKARAANEKELRVLARREERLRARRLLEGPSYLEKSLAGKIPPKLHATLEYAFTKAFALVFSKGKGLIERSYSKEGLTKDFEAALLQAEEKGDRASLRRIGRASAHSARVHTLWVGAQGSLLGVLGIGLPDIPLFSALLLRNLFEVAASYGFPYDTPTERLFLLRLIEISLLRGEAFVTQDESLLAELASGAVYEGSEAVQIKKTASALAGHLLYLKFVQGIPLIGLVGGLSDGLCLHRVSQYARLRYKRRFLQQAARPIEPRNWTNSQK